MITYQLESWDEYIKDCQDLWKEHYDEIATLKERRPMNPFDYRYREAEKNGQLHLITARKDGVMVGYHISFIGQHLHYADVLCGFGDSYFVSKSARDGLASVGFKLFRFLEKTLQQRGVQHIFNSTKMVKDMGRMLTVLGYTPTDVLYNKWIGI